MMNVIRFQLIVLLVFTTFNTFAYSPSVESLFRNSSNEEIGEKSVIANVVFERLAKQENGLQSISNKFYTKFIFGNFDQKNKKFIQVNFADKNFSLSSINKVIYRDNVGINNLGLSNENIEGKVLYSVFASLLNNDGNWIIRTLNQLGSDVKTNIGLVNEQKIELLNRYKKYLVKNVDDSTTVPNPLKDENPEVQSKINEVMEQFFYFKSAKVTQEKVKNRFVWQVKDAIFEARFEHNSRKIEYLKVNTALGNMEFYFKDFILQNSTHMFPKELIFKDLTGTEYVIHLNKLVVFDDSADRFRIRLNKYDKKSKEKSFMPMPNKPSFML